MELILFVIFLGILQGATEFLPVSSSGHLALAENLPFFATSIAQLESEFSLLGFNVLLHLGTILSVLVYMARDIGNVIRNFFADLTQKNFSGDGWRMGWLIIIGTAPLLLVPLYKDYVDQSVKSSTAIGVLFMVNAILLITADILHRAMTRNRHARLAHEMKYSQALIIGLFQCIAVFPGISRSGSTIVGALLQRFRGFDSVRFSFLLSIPALLGATVFELKEAMATAGSFSKLRFDLIAIGVGTAFISGLLSIRFLAWIGHRMLFYPFGIYTGILGLLTLLLLR